MKLLSKLAIWYNKFEEYAMVIFLGIMTAVVFVQVVLRYVFNSGLAWSEEGARFLFMWIIWMSMSIGFRDKSHICMTIVSDKLSPNGKRVLNVVNNLIILTFSLFIAYLGWIYVARLITTGQYAPATKLPYALVYSCLPLSLCICSIRVVIEIIEDAKAVAAKEV